MITIMRAQIEFEDPGWRKYDEAYRDKAASMGNRKWSAIDPHLYNQLFTGRAKKVPLCSLCGNSGHTAITCKRKRLLGDTSHREGARRRPRMGNFCWDYNSGTPCQFHPNCRYKHRCAECGDEHPEIHCPKKKVARPTGREGEQKQLGGGTSNKGSGKPDQGKVNN